MRKHQIITILLVSILIVSCQEKPEKTYIPERVDLLEPQVDFTELKMDFTKWWSYYLNNISLSRNFTGLNEKSDTIEKKQFLEQLISSNYVPLKLQSNGESETYKLFKLDSLADRSIGTTIMNESLTSLKHYKMEGLSLPEFKFTDLHGNQYTSKNTKGKMIVLKTWFIKCGACVAEFPELNEFVEKYQQRNDIIFVSLALDSKPELDEFLKNNNFEYKVIPNQKDFIVEKLNLQIYPTHIIVDENGVMLKVVNKASEMISFLENEI